MGNVRLELIEGKELSGKTSRLLNLTNYLTNKGEEVLLICTRINKYIILDLLKGYRGGSKFILNPIVPPKGTIGVILDNYKHKHYSYILIDEIQTSTEEELSREDIIGYFCGIANRYDICIYISLVNNDIDKGVRITQYDEAGIELTNTTISSREALNKINKDNYDKP